MKNRVYTFVLIISLLCASIFIPKNSVYAIENTDDVDDILIGLNTKKLRTIL